MQICTKTNITASGGSRLENLGEGHGPMASAKCEPIMGVWGRAGQGVRGTRPPEAETVLDFGHSMEAANLPTLFSFENAKNHGYWCKLHSTI